MSAALWRCELCASLRSDLIGWMSGMSGSETDYYKILGVAPTASADEIKRHYRELARKYHPDVNPSADAAQLIKVINEAYHHVGDSDRRSLYDAERSLHVDHPGSRPAPTTRYGSHPPEQRSAYGARSGKSGQGGRHTGAASGQKSEFNGFGRVGGHGSSQRRTEQGGTPPQGNAPKQAEKLVADARLEYISHRYGEAERLCRAALAIDRRQAVAHEILGDIYAKRGDRERATTSYAYAIQFDPRNQVLQAKLERLLGSTSIRSRYNKTTTQPLREPLLLRMLRGPQRDLLLAFVSLAALTSLFLVLFFFYDNPGDPSLVGELSLNLLGALCITGTLVGLLLALYGGMRPMSQEMVLYTRNRRPLGLIGFLVGSAVIWFYASLAAYIAIAIRQNRLSTSLLRAYGAAFVLTLLFVGLYQPAQLHEVSVKTAAFAGNLLFPTIVFGWRIGDYLRLGGA